MSKEKKNRFYYSKNQNEIDEEMWNMPTRFTFVKTPDGWKQYSEWCSVKGVKCNWEDAELVYETDDEPEIIVHEGIPEFINDLEAKLAESEEEIKNIQQVSDKYYGLYKEKFNRVLELAKENNELKQQLAEKEKEIEELEQEKEYIKKHEEIFADALTDIAEKYEELKNSRTYIINFGDKVKEVTIQNQDKISFSVEQLEKVKEYCNEEGFKKVGNGLIRYFDLADFIDNQIKQLREKE